MWIRKLTVSISLRETTLNLNRVVRSLCKIIISRDICQKSHFDSQKYEYLFLYFFLYIYNYYVYICLFRNRRSSIKVDFIPRNDDEILGTFLLQIFDTPRLYSSLNYSYYPTMLSKNTSSPTEDHKTQNTSQQQQQQQSLHSILESNYSTSQYETHQIVNDEIESEIINKSDIFRPYGITHSFFSFLYFVIIVFYKMLS